MAGGGINIEDFKGSENLVVKNISFDNNTCEYGSGLSIENVKSCNKNCIISDIRSINSQAEKGGSAISLKTVNNFEIINIKNQYNPNQYKGKLNRWYY